MPVGTDGSTVDFPNPQLVNECSTFGYSFDYACAQGDTYSVQFDWKTLVLNDLSGKGVTVQAPVTGSYRIAVSGEAITGPTGATGATGANWRGEWASSTSYVYGDVVYEEYHTNWNLSSLTTLGITNGSFVCILNHTSTTTNGLDRPGRSTSTDKWNFVAGGLVGPEGQQGNPGPEAITFELSDPAPGVNRFVYLKGSPSINNGGTTLASLSDAWISMEQNNGQPIIRKVREDTTTLNNPGANIAINANSNSIRNTCVINLDSNVNSIQLTNYGTGDYHSLFLKQPVSGSPVTYASNFVDVNGDALTDIYYAGGYTLPVGSDLGDVDLFYIFCTGVTAAAGGGNQPIVFVNHQQFHDGV